MILVVVLCRLGFEIVVVVLGKIVVMVGCCCYRVVCEFCLVLCDVYVLELSKEGDLWEGVY